VDSFEIVPLLKIKALNLQMRAKLSFDLAQNSLGITWVINHMDNLVNNYIRNLLSLPQCATTAHFPLPFKQLGQDLTLPSMLYEQAQAGVRLSLAQSTDPAIVDLHKLTQVPLLDSVIQCSQSRHFNQKLIKKTQLSHYTSKLNSLDDQNLLMNNILSCLSKEEIDSWSKHLSQVTPSVACFAQKAIVRCLPTLANLVRWHKSTVDTCPHCGLKETDRHVLNNCINAVSEGRYTWRHNAVLNLLLTLIKPRLNASSKLYADVPGYYSTSEIFDTHRPDVAVIYKDTVYVLELTCCHELNFESSRSFKQSKYSALRLQSTIKMNICVFTLEVSSLGFVASSDLFAFCRSVDLLALPTNAIRRLGEMSLRCSFFIFCNRHKHWPTYLMDPVF
jgi:hypothetical protein